MIPKPLQNRSWRGSGGLLGAIFETRCLQDFIFDDFGSILGPPLGPVWGHFGHHFFDVFFEVAFWWPWPPFGVPKHLQNETQKGGQNQNMKFIDFASIYYTLATFRGAEHHHFLNTVLGWLLDPILPILNLFWGPFWRSFWSLFVYPFCINF